MSSDLTFITNESGKNLRDRFGALLDEQEIDELVYALYPLTPEEIKTVESASVQTSARQGHAAK